jgi:hypothetical protein
MSAEEASAMTDVAVPRSRSPRADVHRRRPPLALMRLGPFARAGLIGLRVLLCATTLMAGYAAFCGPHG